MVQTTDKGNLAVAEPESVGGAEFSGFSWFAILSPENGPITPLQQLVEFLQEYSPNLGSVEFMQEDVLESIAENLNPNEFQAVLKQLGLGIAGIEYIPMRVLLRVLKEINYDLRLFAELLLNAWGGKFNKRYKKLTDPKRLRQAQRRRERRWLAE